MKLNALRHMIPAACLALLCMNSTARATVVFTDDFNRPDSGVVGNGWASSADNLNGSLVIRNNALSTSLDYGNNSFASVFRSVDFSGSVRVQATFTETNGLGGLHSRFGDWLTFFNDGTIQNGLSVIFFRGDQNFTDSAVFVRMNGLPGLVLTSSFQFTSAIETDVTVLADGSISGIVSEGANSFAFSAGPSGVPLTGGNFAIGFSPVDQRSGGVILPTADNVTITSDPHVGTPAPAPATIALLALGLGLLRLSRRTVRAGS